MGDLKENAQKIRAGVEVLGKRNTELASEVARKKRSIQWSVI